MRRCTWIVLACLVLSSCAFVTTDPGEVAVETPTEYVEWDVARLRSAMDDGTLTSLQLVEFYLARIAAIDAAGPELRSILEVNPDAREIARRMDAERAEGGPRGPLHGIPFVVKANIDTGAAMTTTAGSAAMTGHRAPDDAALVAALRDAGAVLLGKANLSEWANFRSTRSSSGWSSLGGQTRNPYDTLRTPCGSSSGSGVAVAANLATLAVGTETDGSITCPAGVNGVVGIKPTLGVVRGDGIVPLAHSQDTAGPMARTVRDAALMLDAMDTREIDYAAALHDRALEGARIGVLRGWYGEGSNPRVDALFEAAVEMLAAEGAVLVDDLEIDTDGMGAAEYEVLLYEFKADLEAYLADAGAPVKTLDELIAYNEAHAESVMPYFDQEIVEAAAAKGPLTDDAYVEALKTSKRIAREGIDGLLERHDLVALVAPTNGPAWMIDWVNGDHHSISSSSFAAVSGYANVTVPAGDVFGLPVGLSFIGGADDEPVLLPLAYDFEQARGARPLPTYAAGLPTPAVTAGR